MLLFADCVYDLSSGMGCATVVVEKGRSATGQPVFGRNFDWIPTKGLPEHTVILRHVLRAALPPIITVGGLAFANVMTGTVLVESIFSWPGIGQYAFHSATTLDLPAIMGVSLFVAVVYIAVNFVVDVLYGVVDPRIRVA